MAFDVLRGYVQLANGLTEVTRRRAVDEAKALLAQRPELDALVPQAKERAADVSGQVQALADELMATSKANRDLLGAFVRAELERGVTAFGLVRSDELEALRARVDRLEGGGATAKPAAKKSATKKSAAKKSAVTKAPAKKSTAKKSTTTTKKTTRKST
jgi:hypothetical protein